MTAPKAGDSINCGTKSAPLATPVESALSTLERWTQTQLASEIRRAYERGRAHVFDALLFGIVAGGVGGFILGLLFT